jgi:hypothetical protein
MTYVKNERPKQDNQNRLRLPMLEGETAKITYA